MSGQPKRVARHQAARARFAQLLAGCLGLQLLDAEALADKLPWALCEGAVERAGRAAHQATRQLAEGEGLLEHVRNARFLIANARAAAQGRTDAARVALSCIDGAERRLERVVHMLAGDPIRSKRNA